MSNLDKFDELSEKLQVSSFMVVNVYHKKLAFIADSLDSIGEIANKQEYDSSDIVSSEYIGEEVIDIRIDRNDGESPILLCNLSQKTLDNPDLVYDLILERFNDLNDDSDK